MKKLLSIFFALAFIVCAAFPASAHNTDSSGTTKSVEYLNNGIKVVTILETVAGRERANKGSSLTKEYYSENRLVGSATLTATFSYDGITAHATSASSSHWVASGWSYSGESVYTSGATAYLSATISGSTTIPVDITLTCDPYGNIY